MRRKFLNILIGLLLITKLYSTETVSQLQASYSGTTLWDATSGTLTFTGSGAVNFTNKVSDCKNFIWLVPSDVKIIHINANVTVDGAFHLNTNCTIEGDDQNTSKIFGTSLQEWADANNPNKTDLEEWNYCQIQVWSGSATIKNLTIYNPRAYAVRGWGKVIHMKKVRVIDDRGGWHNHSDGFEGGDGSTIDSCYFESGDDIIKVYFPNLTVSNTTIKMIQNTVPIQFGRGSYGNASAVFNNVRIIGDFGRDGVNPIFDYKSGTNTKSVVMNNCYIENINGTLFRCQATRPTLNITINNSFINVKMYEDTYNADGNRTICGTTDKLTKYNCSLTAGDPTLKAVDKNMATIYPNPTANKITIQLNEPERNVRLKITDLKGKNHFMEDYSYQKIINLYLEAFLPKGIYFFEITGQKRSTVQKVMVL